MYNVCVLCEKPVLKYSISKMSLHVFPSCPKKRQIWLNQCKLAKKDVLPNRKICSLHFEPRCFKTGVKIRVLNPDAVPTIFGNGHVKTTLKIAEGRPKNHLKNKMQILLQNRKAYIRRISLAKAAKRAVAIKNLKSRDVTPRVVTNADIDRLNSILEHQMGELNELRGYFTELKKEKLSLASLLELLVRKQIALSNLIKI